MNLVPVLVLCASIVGFGAGISESAEVPPPAAEAEPQTLFDLGQMNLQAGQYAQAEQIFHQVLEADPDNVQVLQSLGNAQWAQNLYSFAIRNFRQYMRARPGNAPLADWLAHMGYAAASAPAPDRARGRLGDNPDISAMYDRDAPPELSFDPETLADLAREYARCHLYAGAEALFRQVLDMDPDHSEIYHELGDAQWAQGKKAEAAGSYRSYLAARPDAQEMRNWLNGMGYLDDQGVDDANWPSDRNWLAYGLNPQWVIALSESYGVMPSNAWSGGFLYKDIGTALDVSLEWSWFGLGTGVSYDGCWDNLGAYNEPNFGNGNTFDVFLKYNSWSIPLYCEFFIPHHQYKIGIRLGPSVAFLNGSYDPVNWGAESGALGYMFGNGAPFPDYYPSGTRTVNLQLTPICKFILSRHTEGFVELRLWRQLYCTPDNYDFTEWGVSGGAGFSYRI
jgi:tetratricopeptide (TPR) repeat protein